MKTAHTAHLICARSGVLAASGTGKSEGHAILAAVTEYGTAIGARQSWYETFSLRSQPLSARIFEVYYADGQFGCGDEDKIAATGERWGLIELKDYVEPVVNESDDDDDEDLDEAA
ncbi:hypothetical protein [Hoeflea olei]|uniref:Uncharacterized protein n=1 Tax=Hoeflea olei TaxID=1480615 RepID=A0A1C1YS85_9HYPH|nr:hypothetical protein [Hoeflea olei]OCW56306.1 hypothetical protein AWJ14_19620 [Hoeflea olei]